MRRRDRPTLGRFIGDAPDRLALIEQIWDSLPEHVNPDEVPQWHLVELAKRRAEADASPRAGQPWREALARFGSGS